MKFDSLKKLNKYKSNLNQNKGSSYIEFVLGFICIVVILTIIIQAYSIVHLQIIVMNTARSALRQIEVQGRAPLGFVNQIQTNSPLAKAKEKNASIGIIEITVNDDAYFEGDVYQLRSPIKLRLQVKYNIFFNTGLTLAATYTGSSQKFDKNAGYYEPVVE